jgi:hypothetical protein
MPWATEESPSPEITSSGGESWPACVVSCGPASADLCPISSFPNWSPCLEAFPSGKCHRGPSAFGKRPIEAFMDACSHKGYQTAVASGNRKLRPLRFAHQVPRFGAKMKAGADGVPPTPASCKSAGPLQIHALSSCCAPCHFGLIRGRRSPDAPRSRLRELTPTYWSRLLKRRSRS